VAEHSSRQPRRIQENIGDPAVQLYQRRRQLLLGEEKGEERQEKKAAATAKKERKKPSGNEKMEGEKQMESGGGNGEGKGSLDLVGLCVSLRAFFPRLTNDDKFRSKKR
jgi:hypothetical protein